MPPTLAQIRERALADRSSVDSCAWHLLVNVVGASYALRAAQRSRLYARCGIQTQTDWILPGCYFFSSDVSFGSNTWINHRCYFDSRAPVTIGAGCDVAMEVMFCTSSHHLGGPEKRAGEPFTAPIVVEDGVWIGTRAVVLPGVTVGHGCVVASGAVVTRSCNPNGLYAGVPARRIRDLDHAGGTAGVIAER